MNNNKKWVRLSTSFLALILVFNLFIINANASVSNTTLSRIKQIIRQDYIEDVPTEVYDTQNIEDLVKLLGDPYTQYFTAKDYNSFKDQIDMKFVGIGIHLEMVPAGVKVVSLIEGAPAEGVGIKPEDIIISANGTSLEGLSNEEAVSLIKGEEGTFVKLQIKRGESILDFSVVRKEIQTPSVTGSVLNKHIGYIKLESFGSDTSKLFNEVLKNLKYQGSDSYIVDLRNNPGGYMHAALDIAGYFIGNKTAMVVEDKSGNKEELAGFSHDELIDKPVVFLINEYSASASEILAAAVKDYDKAYFIGENSYGKGVAQSLYEFEDGSALKTTTMRFLSPLGNVINKVGISPNIEIEDIDSLLAAELLLGNSKNTSVPGKYISVALENKDFEINLNDIKGEEYWNAYKYIIGKASLLSLVNNSTSKIVIPEIKLASPVVEYKAGDRVAFKLNAPNYGGRVQYRVMLWDDETKVYHDLWTTGDRYYSQWKPYGNETFTLGLPISEPGNYKLKVFVKRAGLENSKTAFTGMNCDSYLGEIPFTVE
ncbi:MAG: carboxyl-terminal protease [Clostridiales bacterium]|jgi:carboxyl-terminal processing protease|nr:carboxyl-terminal protease [Clostridiales bacterium]